MPLILASCFTIHGNVDLSYVPLRTQEELYKDQIRTEMDVNAEIPIGKDKLIIGTSQITYMNFGDKEILNGLFHPTSQDYIAYAKYLTGNLEFYAFHNCNHPINKEFLFQNYLGFNKETAKHEVNQVSGTGETRIGVKLEW